MSMDRNRLRYVTEVFVAECRRQKTALTPDQPNPVKALGEYSGAQQAALMRAMEKALVSAKPAADAYFNEWLSKQRQDQ